VVVATAVVVATVCVVVVVVVAAVVVVWSLISLQLTFLSALFAIFCTARHNVGHSKISRVFRGFKLLV
jgi:hypothetical protein